MKGISYFSRKKFKSGIAVVAFLAIILSIYSCKPEETKPEDIRVDTKMQAQLTSLLLFLRLLEQEKQHTLLWIWKLLKRKVHLQEVRNIHTGLLGELSPEVLLEQG